MSPTAAARGPPFTAPRSGPLGRQGDPEAGKALRRDSGWRRCGLRAKRPSSVLKGGGPGGGMDGEWGVLASLARHPERPGCPSAEEGAAAASTFGLAPLNQPPRRRRRCFVPLEGFSWEAYPALDGQIAILCLESFYPGGPWKAPLPHRGVGAWRVGGDRGAHYRQVARPDLPQLVLCRARDG